MRFFCQTFAYPREGVGAHTGRPAFQPLWRPPLMMTMPPGIYSVVVLFVRMKAPRLTGDHLPVRPGFKQVVEGMKLYRLTDVLMGY